jgi:hypothetical protein
MTIRATILLVLGLTAAETPLLAGSVLSNPGYQCGHRNELSANLARQCLRL